MKIIRKEKWRVERLLLNDDIENTSFTNLKNAKTQAKKISNELHNYEICICLIDEETYYFDYLNGKCVRNGWDRKNHRKETFIMNKLKDVLKGHTFDK